MLIKDVVIISSALYLSVI